MLGAFFGLLIGYYCLNLVFGERFDLLPIPLPGIPHTYDNWSGGEKPGADEEEAAPDPSLPWNSPDLPEITPDSSAKKPEIKPRQKDYVGQDVPPLA